LPAVPFFSIRHAKNNSGYRHRKKHFRLVKYWGITPEIDPEPFRCRHTPPQTNLRESPYLSRAEMKRIFAAEGSTSGRQLWRFGLRPPRGRQLDFST
jgi:hypothetical protein